MEDQLDPVRTFHDRILSMCPSANRREAITRIAWVVGEAIGRHADGLSVVLEAIERTEGTRNPEETERGVAAILREIDPSCAEEAATKAATALLRAAGANIPEWEPVQIDIEALRRQLKQEQAEMDAWPEERRLQRDDDSTVAQLCDNTDDDAHPLVIDLMRGVMARGRQGRVDAAASVMMLARDENPDDSLFNNGCAGPALILGACDGRWPDAVPNEDDDSNDGGPRH